MSTFSPPSRASAMSARLPVPLRVGFRETSMPSAPPARAGLDQAGPRAACLQGSSQNALIP